MYGVANGFLPKPPHTGPIHNPTLVHQSQTQHNLTTRVIGRPLSTFIVSVFGIAGCS
jgi:hypothetical protein